MFTWWYYELGKQFRFDTLIIQKGYFERAISVRADSPIFFLSKFQEISGYYSNNKKWVYIVSKRCIISMRYYDKPVQILINRRKTGWYRRN